jgi:hypothetical protein
MSNAAGAVAGRVAVLRRPRRICAQWGLLWLVMLVLVLILVLMMMLLLLTLFLWLLIVLSQVRLLVLVARMLLLNKRVKICWLHTRLSRSRVSRRLQSQRGSFGGLSHDWEFN